MNSDEDTEVIKKRRRLYARKDMFSSSEEEPSNSIKKKKIDNYSIDNYPKIPQISKKTTISKLHMIKDKENCLSEQENETQHIQFQENYNISSDIHHIKGKSVTNKINVCFNSTYCTTITDSQKVQRLSNQNISHDHSTSNVQYDKFDSTGTCLQVYSTIFL